MNIYTKKAYSNIICWGRLIDSTLWQFIFVNCFLYVAKNIDVVGRSTIDIVDGMIGIFVFFAMQHPVFLNFITNKVIYFQVASWVISVFTRLILVAHPIIYQFLISVKMAILDDIIFTVSSRLENKFLQGDELTQLQIKYNKFNKIGFITGNIIAILTAGISIDMIAYISIGFCCISYPYDIFILKYQKRILNKIEDIELAGLNLYWE